MEITPIKQFTPPANLSIDIIFGENIHATAVYNMNFIDYEEGEAHLIHLLAPIGHNHSDIDLMDDLSSESTYKARIALRDLLAETAESKRIEQQLRNKANQR
jgi:hypothetical protein